LHYLSTSHHQGLGKNSIVLSNKFLEWTFRIASN
jgi:hypothetical protein